MGYNQYYDNAERAFENSPKRLRQMCMSNELPYVMVRWEGREIIYNRNYKPIWERNADGVVTRSNEKFNFKWVHANFYDSARKPPWLDKFALERCEGFLADWGVLGK